MLLYCLVKHGQNVVVFYDQFDSTSDEVWSVSVRKKSNN
jgi:hypothetical protein